jgi:hypothetical protein
METLKNANADFAGSNGTEDYYRHHLTQFIYSQGIKDIAERYQAYWLIDFILNLNKVQKIANEEFQIWILSRVFDDLQEKTNIFSLEMNDGNGNVIFNSRIPFSDFNADIVTMYFENSVLYLPEER